MADTTDDHVSALMMLLTEQWVMSLATNGPAGPKQGHHHRPSVMHSSLIFYAVAPPNSLGDHFSPILIHASDPRSLHSRQLRLSSAVAASIHHATPKFDEIRGVQMRGKAIMLPTSHFAREAALSIYLARHPLAAATLACGATHQLYGLQLTWAKLTDNRRGFGLHPELQFSRQWNAPAE